MRPTSRPEKPYTRQEILNRIWQHFIVEKNPRSYNPINEVCCYNQTGCAVGCLLTKGDERHHQE